jgi:hypothetical protein
VPAFHRIGERLHAVEMHRHVGMGAGEALQQVTQAPSPKGERGGHLERSGRAGAAIADRAFRALHVRQRLPGLTVEHLAFLGQRQVPAVAAHQGHAQARLQLRQAAAHHRQRQAQTGGRLRQAAGLGHADE